MRIPTANFAGHLMWTRSGVIWATWRLQGLPDGYTTEEIRQLVLEQHQALFQGLRGEAMLLGLCACTDPVDIVDNMLEGLIAEDVPVWLECVPELLQVIDPLAAFDAAVDVDEPDLLLVDERERVDVERVDILPPEDVGGGVDPRLDPADDQSAEGPSAFARGECGVLTIVVSLGWVPQLPA